MVFKEATDCCSGTAVIYGAPDVKKMAQFFNGTAIDCCEPVLPRDTIFTISDATDCTALIRFDATSITTCTTRVVTVPDVDVTLIDSHSGCSGQVLTSTGMCSTPTFQGNQESFIIAVGDETTNLTTGNAKVTFRMPYAFTVTAVRGSVTTAPTGCTILTVDIHETGTTIMACCKIEFDAGEFTSTTACMTPVVSDTALADDAQMTIDIDAIGSTAAGKGLKVTIIGTRA